MNFIELGLSKPITDILAEAGYAEPTPIQTKAIPLVLAGRDVVGLAQTGTGKTAAFGLPIIQRLAAERTGLRPGMVRALILSPTRELAAQIHDNLRRYSRGQSISTACVVGGVSAHPQRKALARGVDILVATPGRLLDLAEQKALSLSAVTAVVLDEADHMLGLGFIPVIRRIMSMVPAKRQTLLFSATMPKEIRELSNRYLDRATEISVVPEVATADRVDQRVMHMLPAEKPDALTALVAARPGARVIVFTRTKRGADKVAKRLAADGIGASAIHGNKSQNNRERTLKAFKSGTAPVLVATDIAARGIDVSGVELVVNYELPNVPEVYVHRIGRTARAGASGLAVSFCAGEERDYLRDIERLIGLRIPTDGDNATASAGWDPLPRAAENKKRPRRRRRRSGGNRIAAKAA
ncbi:MAG: DEAD/DEAH box helicase [Flavobacteriaceae bacterium]